MKRSAAVTLVLMGAACVAGCSGTEVQTAAYASVEECAAAGLYTRQKCGEDFAAAEALHATTAPAYAKAEDCEAEFGQGSCGPAPAAHASGTSAFVPFMLGYMMGGRAGDATVSPAGLYRQEGKPGFVNASGARVAEKTGPLKLMSRSHAARKPAVATRTLSRGGFGARSVSVAA